MAQSLARRYERESQGLPTIVAPAAPATYASEGKRVEVTHVDVLTASSSRPGRSRYRSTRTNASTPAAAPAMTSASRRHRCCQTSNTTITAGTRRAPTCARARANSLTGSGICDAALPRSSVTPWLVSLPRRHQPKGPRPHPTPESHDIARMTEVPIARGTRRRERVARQGDPDGRRSCGRSHVVPSLATAATTRRSRTMPANSPP
jgi:hypothetical protein